MNEATCKQCGAVFVLNDKLPQNLECFCESTDFEVKH